LAQKKLGHLDKARRDVEQASRIIDRLQTDDNNKSDHDLLIGQIFLKEMQTLLGGKASSKPPVNDAAKSPPAKTQDSADAADSAPEPAPKKEV
jgi:hypothetical protein